MTLRISEMQRRFIDAVEEAAHYASNELNVHNSSLSVVSHFVSLYTKAEKKYIALRKRNIEPPYDQAVVFYHLQLVGGIARTLEQDLMEKETSKR